MYKYLMAAALVLVSPAFAVAGGSNSKASGTVRVTNSSSTLVALVAVNPSSSLLSSTTLSQFTSRGGKVINPSGRADFTNVKAGNATVYYALVESSATSVSEDDFSTTTVKVTKGKTTSVTVPVSSSSSSAN